MPTLHQLTNIILKQEVVNILNIANLVPQGIINENQCTDKCTVLCLYVPVPPQWSNNPTAPRRDIKFLLNSSPQMCYEIYHAMDINFIKML